MKKVGIHVMVVVAVLVAAACGQSSESRDRNARSIVGKGCARAGQSKSIGKTLHICGVGGTGTVWFAAVSAKPKGAACKQAGAVKKASAKTSVCAKVGKKQFWVAVQTLPVPMVASVTSVPGEAAASTTTVGTSSSSADAPSSTGAPSAPPTTIVVPNNEVQKTVAALSVPTRSVLTTSVKQATSGVVVSPAPVVQLVDEGGNARGRAGVVVKVSVDNEDVVVGGGEATTNEDGRAVFSKLTFAGVAGPVQATFEPEGMGSINATVELVAGPPSQMMLFAGATSLVAGAQWDPAPSVALVDSAGNFAGREGDEITARVKGGDVLAKATIGADNFAHFAMRAIEKVGTWDIEFAGPEGIEPATTTLTVAPATADRIVVDTVLASTVTNGVPVASQVQVHIADRYGNIVKLMKTSIVMAVSPYVNTNENGVGAHVPQGGVVNGTATITQSGYATFTNPTIEAEAGEWMITFATDKETVVQATHQVKVVAGAAAALQIVTPPAGVRSGLPMTQQPALRLVDMSGNAIAAKGSSITASVGIGYEVSNASAITDDEGVATFKDLSVTGQSGRMDMAFDSTLMPTLTTNIYLAAGEIAALRIVEHAKNAVAGEKFVTSSKIGTFDGSGNVVDERVSVLGQCDGSSDWFGSQTVNGVAEFSDLTVTRAGTATCTYQHFTGTKLLTVNASVAVAAADAWTVEFLTQPPTTASMGAALSATPRVQLVDSFGNKVERSGVAVGMYTTNPSLGISNSRVTTDASGIAEFGKSVFSGVVGRYRLLIAPRIGAEVAAAAETVVSAGPASRVALVTQLAGLASGEQATTQPVLKVTDAWGNPVLDGGWTASVTLVPSSLQTQANKLLDLSGNTTTFGADGFARFSAFVAAGLSGVTYVPLYAVLKDGVNQMLTDGDPVSLAPGIASRFDSNISGFVPSGVAIGAIEQRDAKGNLVDDVGAKTLFVSYQKESGTSWARQVSQNVTSRGTTTIGMRIFGTRNAVGTLTVNAGDIGPLTSRISLTTSAAAGDPAPSGGILIDADAYARTYVEVAPFEWTTFSIGQWGFYSELLKKLETVTIGGSSGWEMPAAAQTTLMTDLIRAGKLTYPFDSNLYYWEYSPTSKCNQWNPVKGYHSSLCVLNQSPVLPVRKFS